MPALDRDRLATSTKRRGKTATGRPAHQVHYSAEAQQRRQLKLGDGDGIVLPTGDHRQVQKSPEPPTSAKQSKNQKKVRWSYRWIKNPITTRTTTEVV